MGEVWLAQDSRLGRKVAIKVLPPEFAAEPERVARFKQEARAAAALNHPHIAAVYDIGEHDAGVRFIVQEYLQGQPLRDLLAAGALPIKRALRLGTEIAEALGAAHAVGIIHRDIKPDNVFVTPDGHAKVLDFGLAKLTEISVDSNPNASQSPTLLGTIAGQVMGTAGYMAPEQVEGSATIDHRADLFAFGSLLYEMASGSRAFAGRSVADILSRIQHEEPAALAELDAKLPSDLQRIVSKLLAKDPDERYQHAADLIVDLRRLISAVDAGTAPPIGESGSTRRHPVAMLVGALTIAAVGTWFGSWFAEGDRTTGEIQFAFDLPDEVVELPRGLGSTLTISPDGQTVAFIGLTRDGRRQLFRRRIDTVGSERVGNLVSAANPAFARDNEWIAVGTGMSRYSRLQIDGGEPFTLCDVCVEGAWGDDGNFYFIRAGALWRQAPDGSGRESIFEPRPEEGLRYIIRPVILPGSLAAVVEVGNLTRGGIAVISFADNRVVTVATDGSDPLYAFTGHIVFARESSLFAVPFDAATLEVGGAAVPVLQNVRVENAGALQADLAENGTLVYSPAVGSSGTSLVIVGRDGEVAKVVGDRRNYATPRVAPDGTKTAVIVNDAGQTEVWIVDLRTGAQVQITDVGSAVSPAWSRDGTEVAFGASEGSGFAIYAVDVDSLAVRDLHTSEYPILPMAFTPDGSSLVFVELSPRSDVYALQLDASREVTGVTALLETEATESAATPSFDGRLLAYESGRGGRREIYVRELATGREVQVSTGGGMNPAWSRTSNELFFRNTEDLMVVSARIHADPTLVAEPHERLFSAAPYWFGIVESGYDITPEGNLLLIRHRDPDSPPDRIHVIVNFVDRLPR